MLMAVAGELEPFHSSCAQVEWAFRPAFGCASKTGASASLHPVRLKPKGNGGVNAALKRRSTKEIQGYSSCGVAPAGAIIQPCPDIAWPQRKCSSGLAVPEYAPRPAACSGTVKCSLPRRN